jgi:hypothetical protein
MALNEVKNEQRLGEDEIWSLTHKMYNCIKTKDMVKLKKEDVGKYVEELENKNQDLKDRYPGIFNMMMRDEEHFDFQTLKSMLNILGRRKRGELSETESDNMVVFSQFNKEVKPKIDWESERPNFEKYEKFMDN